MERSGTTLRSVYKARHESGARLNRRLSAFELIYLCRRDKEVEALQVRKGERWDIYRSGVLWSEAKPHCVPYISQRARQGDLVAAVQ